ncbi:MAG TPA: hypothetical protein VH639_02980 [Bryobacteraceae bacterium]|jgi:hypothetical protein
MPTAKHYVRFEERDINARSVILTGVGVIVGTIVVVFIASGVRMWLVSARQSEGAQTQAAAAVPRQLPPAPRFQPSPPAEFNAYRAEQMAQLNNYNWIDRDKGVVAIPVQRAMDLLVQRGIPPQRAPAGMKYDPPQAGTRRTGFEGKVEPEPK